MLRVSLFSLFVFLSMGAIFCSNVASAAAPDIVARWLTPAEAKRAEMARLAKEHSIAEVREAIEKCRQGKYKDAIPVLTAYANGNDVGATFVLAKLYADGLGVEARPETAERLLLENIKGGHVASVLALAQMKEKDSPAEALRLYKTAAQKKDRSAYLTLGSIYEQGRLGVKPNPKLAFNYYEKIQADDHPMGNFQVARCYSEGIGVSPNALLSTRLYRKSALAGLPSAQIVMAKRYFEGIGVEVDPAAAFGWLTIASQSGSTEAMVLLGQRYEYGDLINKDLNIAGQLYSNAAKRGDLAGRYHLAMLYLQGAGTKADPVRAYVLLDGAQGLPKAKLAFDELKAQLTPEQLAQAKKAIADGKGK